MTLTTRQAITLACASSWASPLSLPFWMPALTRRSSKVRLEGKLHAVHLEHLRLALQGEDGELAWVSFDENTRFYRVEPEKLQVGSRLRVDGLLQSGRLQATEIRPL